MTFEVATTTIGNTEIALKYITDNNGTIWFRAKTVAEFLDYRDTSQSIRNHVDNDDKMKLREISRGVKKTTLTNNEQNTLMINESGLYCLVLASKKEEAKQFKRWVTTEVLPSIRKTGKYEIQRIIEKPIVVKFNPTKKLVKLMDCKKSIDELPMPQRIKDLLKKYATMRYLEGELYTEVESVRNDIMYGIENFKNETDVLEYYLNDVYKHLVSLTIQSRRIISIEPETSNWQTR